ncbi:unnamed protein product [Microthlaspi erraticum]|uniref:Reverse transcriptase domain-containing protein n=1 Tax=Microthlaspi erraticum TaxID=1685480 RepID=A0A6D2JGG7_9BRAS|nr:unnamed protein product [Microthlaspi erraticum]
MIIDELFIRRVLERFCQASGQKVSLDKSKIFFSDNVSRELSSVVSAESGIQATRELGRYLGVPILQRRINKETFGTVLERMSSKLAGWKGRMLSLAGRITLSKAGTWSSTWRSVVVGIRDVIRPGHGWVIGDGQRVNFWADKFLGESLLIDEVVAEVPEGLTMMKASDLWLDGTGWEMGRITQFVSDDTKLELAAVVVDKVSGVGDRLSWKETPDSRFTVSSANRFLSRDHLHKPDMSFFVKQV